MSACVSLWLTAFFYGLMYIHCWAASADPVKLAFLGFREESTNNSTFCTRLLLEGSLRYHLQDIASVKLAHDVDLALERAAVADISLMDNEKALQIARALNSNWALWGTYHLSNDTWFVKCSLLDTNTATRVTQISIDAGEWHAVEGRLIFRILQEMKIRPNEAERQQLSKPWTSSPEALHSYCQALIALSSGHSTGEVELFARKAVLADPKFSDALATLAGVLAQTGKVKEAEAVCLRCLGLRPKWEVGYKSLGLLFLSQHNYEEARNRLRAAANLDPDDAQVLLTLAKLDLQLGFYHDAIEDARHLQQADPFGVYKDVGINTITAAVQRMTPVYVHTNVPASLNSAELRGALARRLSPKEVSLVVNPLAFSEEMKVWAQAVTNNGSSKEAKAKLLFDALSPIVRRHVLVNGGDIRTAIQTFGLKDTATAAFFCNDYAFLFTALARAVGLRCNVVSVEETAEFQTGLHACAAVSTEHGELLIDLPFFWFGAPHRNFTILNDLQAVAFYLTQLPGKEVSVVACKIAPELPLAQLNLLEKCVAEGSLDQARAILPALTKLQTDPVVLDYANAQIALLSGDLDQAIDLARRVVQVRPDEGAYHVLLSYAYAEADRLDDSIRQCQEALNCTLSQATSVNLTNLLSDTNALHAVGLYGRGLGLMHKGELKAALECYSAALQLKPSFPEAYAARAAVERQMTNGTGG